MNLTLINYFFSNFKQIFLSLDIFCPINIFTNTFLFGSLDFSVWLQYSLDLAIMVLHQLVTICALLLIFFVLFKNMFSYSINNYILHVIFDFQGIPRYDLEYPLIFKAELMMDYMKKFRYHWITVLPHSTADGVLTALLSVFLLVVLNCLLYYNNLSLTESTLTLTYNFNCNLMKWITVDVGNISFGLIVDGLSLLMLVVVLSISMLVHYYSIDYMAQDPRLLTFLKYLSGFTLAMVVLVTANNFALLFVGWEGVGIFSYLLIGFWYTRTLALKASLKAVVVNWIGDVALILATALAMNNFGTIEFWGLSDSVAYIVEQKSEFSVIDFKFFTVSIVTVICFFLLIAAVGKSAQFGLHTWLPDAMEGPTPVSALIHAATMVTAGVYLVVWTSFFFEQSEIARNLTLFVGAFTAMFGAVTAAYQFDIKRIIAFSTCSQLGYMFLACGLSAYNLAMFHLFIHAFFKALLFLCAGSVIHTIGDEQDIWWMGGLMRCLPLTYIGLCIGFFSLAGLPFTSGFFSKDTIIELALSKWTLPGLYAYACATVGAWFTAFYSFRFFYFVLFRETRISWFTLLNSKEHGTNMLWVILVLTLITILIGGLTKNPLTSPLSFIFFSDSIFVNNYNFYFSLYENFIDFYEIIHQYVFNYIKLILFFLPFVGAFISLFYYWYLTPWTVYDAVVDASWVTDDQKQYSKLEVAKEFYTDEALNKFFEFKGTTDAVYNKFIIQPILKFAYYVSYNQLDRGWLELLFIKIPSSFFFFFSKLLNQNFWGLRVNFLPGLFLVAVLLLTACLILFKL